MNSLRCQVILDRRGAAIAEVRDRWDTRVVIFIGLRIYPHRRHLFVIITIDFLSTMILITIDERIKRT